MQTLNHPICVSAASAPLWITVCGMCVWTLVKLSSVYACKSECMSVCFCAFCVPIRTSPTGNIADEPLRNPVSWSASLTENLQIYVMTDQCVNQHTALTAAPYASPWSPGGVFLCGWRGTVWQHSSTKINSATNKLLVSSWVIQTESVWLILMTIKVLL